MNRYLVSTVLCFKETIFSFVLAGKIVMPAYLFFEILVGIFTCLIGIGNCLMCYHCTKNQEIEDLGTCHNSADLGVLKTCKPESI